MKVWTETARTRQRGQHNQSRTDVSGQQKLGWVMSLWQLRQYNQGRTIRTGQPRRVLFCPPQCLSFCLFPSIFLSFSHLQFLPLSVSLPLSLSFCSTLIVSLSLSLFGQFFYFRRPLYFSQFLFIVLSLPLWLSICLSSSVSFPLFPLLSPPLCLCLSLVSSPL